MSCMHFSVEETTKEKNQIENAQDRQAITLTQCVACTFSVHCQVIWKERLHNFCCHHSSAVTIVKNVRNRTLVHVATSGTAVKVTSTPLSQVFAKPKAEFRSCCELSTSTKQVTQCVAKWNIRKGRVLFLIVDSRCDQN